MAVMLKVNVILEGQLKLPAVIAANNIEHFRYALLTSCDVEHSFSSCKNILTDRLNFLFENLKVGGGVQL